MQTYAYNLGLEKSVSEMTQAEKMQLRLIAILDQSKVSWGDLANTINSPSNMIRQFKTNLSELGIVFGQLFIPMLQRVLPAINGLTIALKQLFVNLAGFMGIEIDFDAFGEGYTDMEEGLEGVEESYNDATAAAEKFNKKLGAFDELNNITTSADTSGTDKALQGTIDLTEEILKATEEYDKVWNAAFEKMENEAQNFADRITGFFSDVADSLKPTTDALQSLWDNSLSKFKDFSLGTLGDFYNNFLIPVGEWTVGKGLPTLIKSLEDMTKDIDWNKLKSALSTLYTGLSKFVVGIGQGAINFFEVLGQILTPVLFAVVETASTLFEALGNVLESMDSDAYVVLGGALAGIATALLGFKAYTAIHVAVSTGLAGIATGLGAIAAHPIVALTAGLTGFIGAIEAFKNANRKARGEELLSAELEKYGDTLDNIVEKAKNATEETKRWSEQNRESYDSLFVSVGVVKDLSEEYFKLSDKTKLTREEEARLHYVSQELIDQMPELEKFYDNQTNKLNITREALEDLIEAKEKEIALNVAGDLWTEAIEKQTEIAIEREKALQNLQDAVAERNKYQGIIDSMIAKDSNANVTEYQRQLQESERAVESFYKKIVKLNEQYAIITEDVDFYKEQYTDAFSSTIDKDLSNANNVISDSAPEFSNTIKQLGEQIKQSADDLKFQDNFSSIGQDMISGIITGIEAKKPSLRNTIGSISSLATLKLTSDLQIHSPSRVMAELGEYTIAGFEQGIVNGYKGLNNAVGNISNIAVEPITENFTGTDVSNEETLLLLRQQNELLQGILEKETGISSEAIFKSVRHSAQEYTQRTGKFAFVR